MKNLSKRSTKILPQPMFEIMDSASINSKTIHLEIGDTSYFRNKSFNSLLKKNIIPKNMSYAPSSGDIKLRGLMSKIYSKRINHNFTEENVVVAPCNGLITQFLLSTTNIGDELLIPDPGFPTYSLAARALDLKAHYYKLHQKNNWQPSLKKIEKIIKKNKKIKVLIICTPSNPVGTIISGVEFKKIVLLAAQNNILCLVDDTYRQIKFHHKDEYLKFHKNIFYIYSMSKDAGIPSARLGFGIGNKYIIKKIIHQNSLINSCHPLFIQKTAFEYLVNYQGSYIKDLKSSILKRISVVEKFFRDSQIIEYTIPDGGIFFFIKIKNIKISSIDLAQDILKKTNVCVCPGSVFGPSGENCLRLNLAVSIRDLQKACRKINNYLIKYYS